MFDSPFIERGFITILSYRSKVDKNQKLRKFCSVWKTGFELGGTWLGVIKLVFFNFCATFCPKSKNN